MKKILRLSLDYEVEIKEIVEPSEDPGEYCWETVEKVQAIVNALVQNPGALQELLRFYLYQDYNNDCLYDEDTYEERKILTVDEIIACLKPYLPPCLVPYCMKVLFNEGDDDSFLVKNDGKDLLDSQIYNIKSINFLIEEIGADGNPVFYEKETVLAEPAVTVIADRTGCADYCIKNCAHRKQN